MRGRGWGHIRFWVKAEEAIGRLSGPERGFGGFQGMPRAVQLGNSACKCEGEAGARLGAGPRRESLLEGSRAREEVRRLPGYAVIYGIRQ